MKIIEFHTRIMQIMKIIKCNAIITKIRRIHNEHQKNYKNLIIPQENHEYHENSILEIKTRIMKIIKNNYRIHTKNQDNRQNH